MSYHDNQYMTAQDLSFVGILHDIKKSKTSLQPVFEAFTNALEAIKIKKDLNKNHMGEIAIKIYASSTTLDVSEFSGLSIQDNGIGFNENQFKRFNKFKDISKGFKNLGSGRIQFVHYFENTTVNSVFEEGNIFYERLFTISKNDEFLKNNAIVLHNSCKKSLLSSSYTRINFQNLIAQNSSIYNDLNDENLKLKLIE